jgi:NAD(P)H dehydrogenase (quinone)
MQPVPQAPLLTRLTSKADTPCKVVHFSRLRSLLAQGAKEVAGVEASILQVPELVPDNILEQLRKALPRALAHIPVARVEQLRDTDALIFGTPTRFGKCSQMRNFLDQCGGHWARGTLINKIGRVFAGVGTQHEGHETTILGSISP